MEARDSAGAQESAPAEVGSGGLPEVVDVAELPDAGSGATSRGRWSRLFAGLLLAQGRVWVGFWRRSRPHLAELRAGVVDTSLVRTFRARFTEVSMVGVSVTRNGCKSAPRTRTPPR